MLTALGFLTAMPVPRRVASAAALARALIFFPLVGLLVGALLLALDLLLAPLLPNGVRVALLLGAGIGLTRALHLDGLMDCCDGLFGGFTPEHRLEVMRDSRVGAFGVLGAIVVLLLRFNGLTALSDAWLVAGLLLPPTLGRWAMALAIVAYPYGRPTGLGVSFKAGASWRQVALAGILATGAATALWWPWGVLALPVVAALTAGVARFMRGRLPGLTGDCYGAINEIVEVVLLLAVVAAQTVSGR